ncbi:MAG: molybdopterin molybdotransferase MoeA [Bacteriovoracaceae bacterium]|nr:molybdopterin molybdotransferase MoeA [Bacteriovoracaceae bacterium]
MISVLEAFNIIDQYPLKQATTYCHIDKLVGEVLAEDILAERMMPPFNRVLMDGIAIKLAASRNLVGPFEIAGMAKAGEPLKSLNDPSSCLEVMTGAMLPKNCDCVVPYEQVSISEGRAIISPNAVLTKMHYVAIQGSDVGLLETLINSGTIMQSHHVGIIAGQGIEQVSVFVKPKVAIISTGDEIVAVGAKVLPHQIRDINTHALRANLHSYGIDKVNTFHFIDDQDELYNGLSSILEEYQVIILSGGVSMGKFDFVPKVLTDLKVESKFHKVAQKPGKPLWFGVGLDKQLVFGLPGNPISALVSLRKFIMPSIFKSFGVKMGQQVAKLDQPFSFSPQLTYYLPVKIHHSDKGELLAIPLPPKTSGDFARLGHSDGFIQLPAKQNEFSVGEAFTLYGWDG